MSESLPSLELISEETRLELERAVRHSDAVDTKAGVILGAAGAVAAISSTSSARLPALLAAVLAGVAAMKILWPQRFPSRELRQIRDGYLGSDPRFTALMLLDSGIDIVEQIQTNLEQRERWLRRATVLLVLSGVMHALGSIGSLVGG